MAVDFSLRHLCLLLGAQLWSWPKWQHFSCHLSWRTGGQRFSCQKAGWLVVGWLVQQVGRLEVSGLINLLSGIGAEENGPSAASAGLVQLPVARWERQRNWIYHRSWKDAYPFASVVGSGQGVAGQKHHIKVCLQNSWIAKIYLHDSHMMVQLMLLAAKCLKFLPSCLKMRAFKSFTMQAVRLTSSMQSISNGCLSIVASGSSEIQSGTKGCDDCEGEHHIVSQMEGHRRGNIVSCCHISNPLPKLHLQGFVLGLLSIAWFRVSGFRYLLRLCHIDCYSSNTKARPSNSFDFSLWAQACMIHIIQFTFILKTAVAREPVMQSENRIYIIYNGMRKVRRWMNKLNI